MLCHLIGQALLGLQAAFVFKIQGAGESCFVPRYPLLKRGPPGQGLWLANLAKYLCSRHYSIKFIRKISFDACSVKIPQFNVLISSSHFSKFEFSDTKNATKSKSLHWQHPLTSVATDTLTGTQSITASLGRVEGLSTSWD